MLRRAFSLLAALLLFWTAGPSVAQEPAYTRQADVIYARKYGTVLTYDIFKPAKPNGIGIIYVVSGGWFSGHAGEAAAPRYAHLLNRGYTVFAVVHGSNPKFSIPEIFEDMSRAVRVIRSRAGEYGIDPERIGITGSSAGGHLSLMLGTAGNLGNPDAKDPLERVSSRVQAVACFYPPTDFLNYGKPGENALGRGILASFAGAFDFRELDPASRSLKPITDEARILEIGRLISPINHVSADDPPTLIFHGDKDVLVPLQQSEIIIEKLKAAGVETKLVIKPGAEHGWPNMGPDLDGIADWFDAHLLKKAKTSASP